MKRSGNKVLITGGSSGIGLGLAKKFKELDNTVLITGRDRDKLQSISRTFGFHPIECDLSDKEGVDELVHKVTTEHNDLQIFINNAGTQYNYSFLEEVDANKIQQEIFVNFIAPTMLCTALIPVLRRNLNTALVNVSSGLALHPKQSAPVYCGTKAALHIFTKALRYQLEESEIKVFEIIPPLVDTPMTHGRGSGKLSADQLAEEFMSKFGKDQTEMNIGKVKLLRLISRFSPSLADGILKNN
ncbi:MAG: SDR family NAD(P)-dependent oxidoreductase [Bacteroidota bacterium]